MRTTDARLVTLSLVLGVIACSPDDVEPDVRSQYVDLYLDDEIEVCAGQLDAYDLFIEQAFGVWTGGPPGDFRANMRVLTESSCSHGGSCAHEGTARLFGQRAQYHELSHLLHQATDGRSAYVLNEAVAEGLGPLFPYTFGPDRLETYDFLFADPLNLTINDHGRLAMLARFLIEQYGPDSFRALFRAFIDVQQPTQDHFEQEFEAAVGASLNEAWSAFSSAARCPFDLWYCDVRDLHENFAEVHGLDCSAPQTMGFLTTKSELQYEYRPYTIVHLHVTEEREFEMEFSNWGWFTRCGTCSEGQDMTPWPLVLEEGIYAFILPQNPDQPLHFSIRPTWTE